MKKAHELKKELYIKYREHYCNNGRCKYFAECKNEAGRSCKFYSDKLKLGNKYNSNPSAFPNIMFVGLESKHDDYFNKEVEHIEKPSLDARNPHYKWLRYVLTYILAPYIGEKKPTESSCWDDKYDSEQADVMSRFALTNIYKCAFDNHGKSRGLIHTNTMKEHCQEILFDEIDVLTPDVLIIQVVANKPNNFWGNILRRYSDGKENKPLCGDGKKNNTSVYEMTHTSGKPFLLVWTYHGAYIQQFKDNYSKELNKVLEKTLDVLEKRIPPKSSLFEQ